MDVVLSRSPMIIYLSNLCFLMKPLVTATRQNATMAGLQSMAVHDDMTTLYGVKGVSKHLFNAHPSHIVRYSILPALSLDGILHLDVEDRSYTAAMFNDFVDGLLDNMNPFPGRNSVAVMDNASIHKSPELEEMVLAR